MVHMFNVSHLREDTSYQNNPQTIVILLQGSQTNHPIGHSTLAITITKNYNNNKLMERKAWYNEYMWQMMESSFQQK